MRGGWAGGGRKTTPKAGSNPLIEPTAVASSSIYVELDFAYNHSQANGAGAMVGSRDGRPGRGIRSIGGGCLTVMGVGGGMARGRLGTKCTEVKMRSRLRSDG